MPVRYPRPALDQFRTRLGQQRLDQRPQFVGNDPRPRLSLPHDRTNEQPGRQSHDRQLLLGPLSDLVDCPWVLEPEGSPGRYWAMATCRQAGFEPRVAHETPDVLVQTHLVASGHAAAFLPDLTWFDREPRFHLRQMAASHVRQIVTTCRAGSHRNPALVAVRDALRQAYQHNRPSITNR
ncbi:LysR substrate-binding domain-containing protein [Streptomyces sp. NBC_00582]|uniref:LysR substrate-binding domain-containing protein n=1 Tax=Streptomyces sp. NBC_00582 TaxID=2975783 RepID=UPI003FCE9DF8